jgi:hypothetical protein
MVLATKNRRILLIMPSFFNYQKQLSDAFKEDGWDVRCYDDRPKESFFAKAVIRINRSFLSSSTTAFVKRIINENKTFDPAIVFVINGQSFLEKHILLMREQFCKAEFVLFLWDAMANFPYSAKMLHLFDRRYSIDRGDVANDKRLSFLPLFYFPSSVSTQNGQVKNKQVAFVGTAHPGKMSNILTFLETAKKSGLPTNFYLYLQSKVVWIYYHFVYKDFRRTSSKDFQYKKITTKETFDIYDGSEYVFDAPREHQVGLTMRTFECLGMRKKLITTNQDIKHYDFFNPENIYIFDGKNLDFSNIFFTSSVFKDIPSEIREKYTSAYFVQIIGKEREEPTYLVDL